MCFFTVFHRCHPLLSHRYLAYSSKGSEIIAYSPIMASVVKNAAYSVHPAICFDAWLTIGNICETSLSLLRCLVDQYQIVNLLVDAFVFACTSETGNIIFTRPVQVDSNKIFRQFHFLNLSPSLHNLKFWAFHHLPLILHFRVHSRPSHTDHLDLLILY